MTEQEAIWVLKDFNKQVTVKADGAYQSTIGKMACDIAIKALEEIQKYRAIGTLEECWKAVEKQKPKIPSIEGDGYADDGQILYDTWICPCCGERYEIDYDDYEYCPKCGQHVERAWKDWRKDGA